MNKYIVFTFFILSVFLFSACTPNTQQENIHGDKVHKLEIEINTELTTGEVDYGPATGFLATPSKEGAYPGIVMIHEWWGLNDNIKTMAKQLASEGYTVLAVDLYKGQVATTPEDARTYMSSVDQDEANMNMLAALSYLEKNYNTQNAASLGWCFGGKQSLQFALTGAPLDASVIYYGQVTDDATELSRIEGSVLGIFAGEDQSISVESVEAFDAKLDELEIQNDIHMYEGVGHAFANPSGSRYAQVEADDAWEKTVAFLEQELK